MQRTSASSSTKAPRKDRHNTRPGPVRRGRGKSRSGLEHSDSKASGVFARSWQSSGEGGVILKLVRKPGQEERFKDKGLNANTDEFEKNLSALLGPALGKLTQ
jgi:hypothetical protein